MSRVLRDLKEGELTLKDMSVLREGDSARSQSESNRGVLRDYSLQHRVEMQWNLNDEATRDRMFKFKIDNYEVILDAEELMRYLRWA